MEGVIIMETLVSIVGLALAAFALLSWIDVCDAAKAAKDAECRYWKSLVDDDDDDDDDSQDPTPDDKPVLTAPQRN